MVLYTTIGHHPAAHGLADLRCGLYSDSRVYIYIYIFGFYRVVEKKMETTILGYIGFRARGLHSIQGRLGDWPRAGVSWLRSSFHCGR